MKILRAMPVRTTLNAAFFTAALFLAGCDTIPSDKVAAFGASVGKVKTQTSAALVELNQLALEDSIERAVTLPTLDESQLAPILKIEDIAKWERAFAEIESYVENLKRLISPDRADEFGTAMKGRGESLAGLDKDALPSPGVATAFVELGRILITAAAQKEAIAAVKDANAPVQKAFTAMADAIGPDTKGGLRGTVYAHWQLRMGAHTPDFLTAKDTDAKRKVLNSFVNARTKRDNQDLQLNSLRKALLGLAKAHNELATKTNGGLAGALAMIERELDATKSLLEHFKQLAKTEGA